MNSFEFITTEENLIHTLNKDLFKRNKDLVRFYDLILAQEGASSIAIDGRWGSGSGLMSIFWTQKVKLFYAVLLANNSHCFGVM